MTEDIQERLHDKIDILIPGEQASVRATYRTSDGRAQQVCVREPYVSVIPARQPHGIYCEPESVGIVVAINQPFFENKAREALGQDASTLVECYSSHDPFLREIGNELRSWLCALRIPSQGYMEALAAVIAIHLAGTYCGGRPALPASFGLPSHKLSRVQTYIDRHLAESISVQQLATAVNLSTFHFARMFRQATGHPPHFYITMRRLEHAKQLLRASDLPLVDVAASVGFQTQSHFTGVFRRYSGMTPRAFRLNCRAPVTNLAI
jgi:AraC family transcriptional regulator